MNIFTKNEGTRLFITLYIKHAVCNLLIPKTVKMFNLLKIGKRSGKRIYLAPKWNRSAYALSSLGLLTALSKVSASVDAKI